MGSREDVSPCIGVPRKYCRGKSSICIQSFERHNKSKLYF